MTPTPAKPFALFTRNSFRSRWKLHSTHPTREAAVAASFAAKDRHVWVTDAPHEPPTPTKCPSGEPAHA